MVTSPHKAGILKRLKNIYKYIRKEKMIKSTHKNSMVLDDFILRQLYDKSSIKEFLNVTLETYVEDGNIDEFLSGLELVIKARQSLKSFSEEAKLNRSNLYAIFRGKRKPQMHTILKILSQLGYKLKVA
jgi:probable addiction module antidote protein